VCACVCAHVCVCACVCACGSSVTGCVCVRACVRMCVCVCTCGSSVTGCVCVCVWFGRSWCGFGIHRCGFNVGGVVLERQVLRSECLAVELFDLSTTEAADQPNNLAEGHPPL